jgi:hypothetical protein
MIKIDWYLKIIFTIIAICLFKIAFFSPPRYSFAQFPFGSSDTPIDVNIKSIDDNEIVFSREGELIIGGKKGKKFFENGAFWVRIKKD